MNTLQPNPTFRGSIVLRQPLLISGLILTLLLCGCASRARWKKESFALAAPADISGAGSSTHTNILSLRRLTISPLFEDRALVYRTGENSYEHDPYAEFFVPPNRMLEEYVRTSLRNGHAFAEVPGPDSGLKSSCAMEVSVSELYGDFRQPEKPFAVVQLRFLLYSTGRTDNGRVLWQSELSRSIPLAHRTAAEVVAGWNTGLQQIMEEVNSELNQLAIP